MDDAAQPKLRWYRLTPDRLILGLLAVEAFLLLSQRGGWFAFNQHKGWTVLMAVATVGVALPLLAMWFAVSLIFRWRFQYSLRSLFLLVVAVAVPCSWLATEVQRNRRQIEVGRRLERAGGSLTGDPTPTEDVPVWLLKLVGDNFFMTWSNATVPSDADLRAAHVLSDIENLRLVGDAFTDASLANMHEFSRLRRLYVESADVTDRGWQIIGNLHQLESLMIADTKVTDSDWECIGQLQQLERLSISYTKVTDSALACIGSLNQLRTLGLTETDIGDDGLARLQNLSQLRCLTLEHTKITDAGLIHVGRLRHLRSLRLSGTKVTDAGLIHLKDLSELGFLDLQNTAVTTNGVEGLQRALPNCLF